MTFKKIQVRRMYRSPNDIYRDRARNVKAWPPCWTGARFVVELFTATRILRTPKKIALRTKKSRYAPKIKDRNKIPGGSV